MRKAIWIILFAFAISCTKETGTNTPTATTGNAIFWVASDLGVGTIGVTCNNNTQIIRGYSTSGTPSCGAAACANFTLSPGTYSFTAVAGSTQWSGNVTITSGGCTPLQLKGNGGVNGGGGNNAGTPTVTTPDTHFMASQDYTVSKLGAYNTQQFTLSTTTKFVFRFASQFAAQAAIITPDQLNNFQTNQSFSGYGLFDKQIGTHSLSLSAGTYYLAIRNSNNGPNKWSTELDYDISLPSSDRATFYDFYTSGAKNFQAGSRFWQPFTVQSGFRYFLDGCNVNCDVRIIPISELSAFQNGQVYQYYTDYYLSSGAGPGLFELKLSVGDYYIVSFNASSGALSYVLERWKVN